MTREEFSDLMGRVFLYFGANRPSTGQLDAWYDEVKRIPSQAIKSLEDRLRQRESLTVKMNVPMMLNQEFARMAGTISNPGLMVYDQVEDFRFPVGLMYRAYDVLERSGESEFLKYCDSVKMPRNDRIRVRAKLTSVRANQAPGEKAQELAETESESIPF